MEISVVHATSGKTLTTLKDVQPTASIYDVKRLYQKSYKSSLYPDRQAFKLEQRGKYLKDEDTLKNLGLTKGGKLYFKDLGPQLGWSTVFLCEYAGPLVIYLLFYTRPWWIYGTVNDHREPAVKIACICWTAHYAKRLFETIFVHRFSHATMPIRNLFKNSMYYWGFAAWVAYYVNHPLYTSPAYGTSQMYAGLAAFIFSELGNLSIHIALRNLRPEGTKERRIPVSTKNPLTALFSLVSCPNYTYEFGAWLGFSVMTQCLPALIFTAAGFYQMAMWALGKHRNYKKEFPEYPRKRKAIVPFLL